MMKDLLTPLSAIFEFAVFIRNALYDAGLFSSVRLPGVVISIGNIAAGGTGKSPIVMDLASELRSRGFVPAIVTRGYRSGLRNSEYQILMAGRVVDGSSRSNIRADEALMQSSKLPFVPVIVGAKRVDAVSSFSSKFPEIAVTHWLIDDGFQHRKIQRDLDIVILDGREPWGKLFPVGKFREGVRSLRRADIIVITKSEDPTEISQVEASICRFASERARITSARFAPSVPKLVTREAPLVNRPRWMLVAGIAYPVDFERFARCLDIEIVGSMFAGDHESADFSKLQVARGSFDAILTTEKDWARDEIKFKELSVPTYVLPLSLNWLGQHPLSNCFE